MRSLRLSVQMSLFRASVNLNTFSVYLVFVLTNSCNAAAIVDQRSIMVNTLRGIGGQNAVESANNTHGDTDLIGKNVQHENPNEGGKKFPGSTWNRGANYTNKWMLSPRVTDKLQELTKTMYLSDRHELYTLQLMQHIIKLFDDFGINYFSHGISLFGAYKHLGAVPLVDDLYLVANGRQLEAIRRVISHVSISNFQIRGNGPFVLRMGHIANDSSSSVPRIHISLYYENVSHIWINRSDYESFSSEGNRFIFNKSDVLPLQFVPYYGVKVPVPCNIEAVLSEYFDIRKCYINNGVNNSSDQNSITLDILECDLLAMVYPVMKRTQTKYYTVGFLQHNKTVIETTVTPRDC